MKSSCQLMAKECMLSNGNGIPRNSVARISDRLDMTSAACYKQEQQIKQFY